VNNKFSIFVSAILTKNIATNGVTFNNIVVIFTNVIYNKDVF